VDVSNVGSATLFLCGDVMTGRGVDQVFARSCPPLLHESSVASALDYVDLAERAHGAIPRPVGHSYVWGDALRLLDLAGPHVRIVNLETAVTTSEDFLPKGINYRMHPANVGVLRAARIDCCTLANNHIFDWGRAGLLESIDTVTHAGIATAGAGRNIAQAQAPAVLPVPGGGRILVFGLCTTDSGIPESWAAGPSRPGVHLVTPLDDRAATAMGAIVHAVKQANDVAVASIHWGGNWGFEIPDEHRRFAHALIDRAAIDVVHGHSAHHPKAIEVHHGHLILYGCGDFLDDYEGIRGYERYRDDLVLMYLVVVRVPGGELVRLEMTPLQIRNFRLSRASAQDRAWLRSVLNRECHRFGARVEHSGDDKLVLRHH
jgi:poly-gamma-glutamate synthesis protein (capsule biosynthesis protein)